MNSNLFQNDTCQASYDADMGCQATPVGSLVRSIATLTASFGGDGSTLFKNFQVCNNLLSQLEFHHDGLPFPAFGAPNIEQRFGGVVHYTIQSLAPGCKLANNPIQFTCTPHLQANDWSTAAVGEVLNTTRILGPITNDFTSCQSYSFGELYTSGVLRQSTSRLANGWVVNLNAPQQCPPASPDGRPAVITLAETYGHRCAAVVENLRNDKRYFIAVDDAVCASELPITPGVPYDSSFISQLKTECTQRPVCTGLEGQVFDPECKNWYQFDNTCGYSMSRRIFCHVVHNYTAFMTPNDTQFNVTGIREFAQPGVYIADHLEYYGCDVINTYFENPLDVLTQHEVDLWDRNVQEDPDWNNPAYQPLPIVMTSNSSYQDEDLCDFTTTWSCFDQKTSTPPSIGLQIPQTEAITHQQIAECTPYTINDWFGYVHVDRWARFPFIDSQCVDGQLAIAQTYPTCLRQGARKGSPSMTVRYWADPAECETITGIAESTIQHDLVVSCEMRTVCDGGDRTGPSPTFETGDLTCLDVQYQTRSNCDNTVKQEAFCAIKLTDAGFPDGMVYRYVPLWHCGAHPGVMQTLMEFAPEKVVEYQKATTKPTTTTTTNSGQSRWKLEAPITNPSCQWDLMCSATPDDHDTLGACDLTNVNLTKVICGQTQCGDAWLDPTYGWSFIPDYLRCVSNRTNIDGELDVEEYPLLTDQTKCGDWKTILNLTEIKCDCTVECNIDATDPTNEWAPCTNDLEQFTLSTECAKPHQRDLRVKTATNDTYSYTDCRGQQERLCYYLVGPYSTQIWHNETEIDEYCSPYLTTFCKPSSETDFFVEARCNETNPNTDQLYGYPTCPTSGQCGPQYPIRRDKTCTLYGVNNIQSYTSLYGAVMQLDVPYHQFNKVYDVLDGICNDELLPPVEIETTCPCDVKYLCRPNPNFPPTQLGPPGSGFHPDGFTACAPHIGYGTCEETCIGDNRNKTRNIYCSGLDGYITQITAENLGDCGLLDDPFPATQTTCEGSIACNATYLCHQHGTETLWENNILYEQALASCDNLNHFSDVCYYNNSTNTNTIEATFAEATCIVENDERTFYRHRELQCLTFLEIPDRPSGYYPALPYELVLPQGVDGDAQSAAFCDWIMAQNNKTQPPSFVEDVNTNELCTTQEGCTPTVTGLFINRTAYNEGEEIHFTWSYQGPAVNTDNTIFFEYAIITQDNTPVTSTTLVWKSLVDEEDDFNAQDLTLPKKKALWIIPNNFTKFTETNETNIYIRVFVLKDGVKLPIEQHPIVYPTIINNTNTNTQIITIQRVQSCQYLTCNGANVQGCAEDEITKMPYCKCINPNAFDNCERLPQCEELTTCQNGGYYLHDAFAADPDVQCATTCTCSEDHNPATNCAECNIACPINAGRPFATNATCGCNSCYALFWGDYCDKCNHFLQINITQPNNDILMSIAAFKNQNTTLTTNANTFLNNLFQAVSVALSSYPVDFIVFDKKHTIIDLYNPQKTVLSLMLQIRGQCKKTVVDEETFIVLDNTNIPEIPSNIDPTSISSAIQDTPNVWNFIGTAESTVFINEDAQNVIFAAERAGLDCDGADAGYSGCDYVPPPPPPGPVDPEEPSVDTPETKKAKSNNTVIALAIAIPIAVVLLALIFVTLACCARSKSVVTTKDTTSKMGGEKKPAKINRKQAAQTDDPSLELV